MSDSNKTSAPVNKNEPEKVPLSYEERIDHFSAGYNNAQSVVRFLDTKATAVVGVVPVVLGLLVGMYRWFDAQWQRKDATEVLGTCLPNFFTAALIIVAVWVLIDAGRAVGAAFRTLLPRPPSETKPSILFPFWVKSDSTVPENSPDVDLKSRADFFAKDACQSDAIEDYRRQVVRMSEIVQRKFFHVHHAIGRLKRVFILAMILAAMLFALGVGSALIEQPDGKPADSANTASIPTTKP